MKITDKGQVTIPIEIRQKMGFLPDTDVEFGISGNQVILKKTGLRTRGRRLIASLRGKASRKMSNNQIMALTRGESWPR
jgi:AbrB family looped-hinge helix DNA binding protein